ncbi:tetratricopeptide repeat protein [Adhaeribacter sp. BT258]|uniref:Tetratricopeptide repeat protein n=1 Tax=Adhaeribacter terrigena TaxID=2793070 RepID=A0ABS1BZN7_9BACT|nr:tetratricopeptide repeat protein [Adhaeribacter terrigena]MBK0402611.1 tetratricopeptide repeat protein [Adhaeribacter terrigena]
MWTPVSDAHLEKARLLLDHQKYALAEQELHQVLTTNPEDSVGHALLGLCYLKTSRYPEAFTAATRAIALDAASDYNHRLLSLVYEREKNLPEAEKAARYAITLNPEFGFGYSLLGRILFNKNRLNEALEVVNTGLCYDPEDVECLNLQARIFVRLGKPEAATENFRTSLKQDPENFYTHTNKGIALGETGDYKNAILYFKEAVRLNPDYELAKRYLLASHKMQYDFYRFVMQVSANLLKAKVSEKWLLLLGVWLIFKVSPLFLPFFLILLHLSLFTDVLFNFIVSFHAEAGKLLQKNEKAQPGMLGGLFFLAACFYGAGAFAEIPVLLSLGHIMLGLSVPLVTLFYMKSQESLRNAFAFISYLIIAAMLYLILGYFFPEENPHAGITGAALYIFNFLLIGYCWFRKQL